VASRSAQAGRILQRVCGIRLGTIVVVQLGVRINENNLKPVVNRFALRRPKYWERLVMELIYEKLDADVAQWLKENAPTPKHGQNYHQWLSGQYGLKKVEHIWMVIGMAKTCDTMTELRDRVAALDGKQPVQLRLYLPPPRNDEKVNRRG